MIYSSLHSHTIFSTLDGHSTIKDYVKKVASLGHTSAAITDHGTMAGIPDFIYECNKAGIKPIFGMEAYVEPLDATRRDEEHKATHHLTLLARNLEGYKNLMKMSTFSSSVGFYRKPRVDWKTLEAHKEGIIVLSGCTSAELAHAVLDSDTAKQDSIVDFYRSVFPKQYYLEYQYHGQDYQEQLLLNAALDEIQKRTGLSQVATNDSHFCNADDWESQKLLVGIKTHQKLEEVTLGSRFTYVRSNEEMAATFDPHLLKNTLEIADSVEIYKIGDAQPKLPISPLEVIGESPTDTLIRLTKAGLKYRLGDSIPQNYLDRFDLEIGVIRRLSIQLGADFSRYLLMIADITNFCRESRIRFGPRGSAAGSLVCWALRISEPDPIKDELYFERFLNPFRVELPDVDLDFADDRREEVFGYLRDIYGEENVAKIGTYSMIGPKQAIKDAAKSMSNVLTSSYLTTSAHLISLIPDDPRPSGIPLHKVMGDPEGKGKSMMEYIADKPDVAKLVSNALAIEGRARGNGMHAAGVIVCNEPVVDILPLMWTKEARDNPQGSMIKFQTQYEMMHLEKLGLLKVDILGLKTLTVLDKTLELIKQSTNLTIDPWSINWNDKKTWDLIKSGKLLSLFQIGAEGLSLACNQLQPDTIEDLSLTIAVYRPGPMKSFKEIVARKFGKPIESIHPAIDSILSNTYGFPIYQEQIMEMARTFAGYSLGEADLLRKAMGKKIREKMAEEYPKFVKGSLANGHTEEEANTIWEFILPNADYCFNKAHSLCYAYVGYQTAYLKANYPQEFYTAALIVETTTGSASETPQQRIGKIIREGRSVVQILPPDINHPAVTFEMEGKAIRYGLSSIKNVGIKDAIQITDRFKSGGKFTGIGDLVTRCSSVRRSSFETLALVGAMPSCSNRATLTSPIVINGPRGGRTETTNIGILVTERAKARTDGIQTIGEKDLELVPEYDNVRLLFEEQSHLGMFNTGLPEVLTPYKTISEVRELNEGGVSNYEGQNIVMMGVISSIQHKVTKKTNQTMGYAQLLDESDSGWDLVIFHKNYEKIMKEHSSLLVEGKLLHVSGKIVTEIDTGKPKMFLDNLWEVDLPDVKPTTVIPTIKDSIEIYDPMALQQLVRLYKLCKDHTGTLSFTIIYKGYKDIVGVSEYGLTVLQKELKL